MEWLADFFIFGLPAICFIFYLITVSRLYILRGKPLSVFMAVRRGLLLSRYGVFIQTLGLLYFLAAVVIVAGFNIFGHIYFLLSGDLFDVPSLQRPPMTFIVNYAIPLSFSMLVVSLLRGAHYSSKPEPARIKEAIAPRLKLKDKDKQVSCWMVVLSELMLGGMVISLIMVVWYVMKRLLEVECLLSEFFS